MILADEAATLQAGRDIAARLEAGDVLLLEGPLGAGKTTLVRGLLAARGHVGEVPSPSFAIVQPYDHLDPPVVHVDLYRIDHPSELDELGLDMLDDAILIVEWPDKGGPNAFPGAMRLQIAMDGEGRRLTWMTPPASHRA